MARSNGPASEFRDQRGEATATEPRLLHVIKGLTAYAEPAFNRLIHERTRLAIMSALAASESLSFRELKNILGTSDGNLSVHARKLEEAGYVETTKYFEGRIPRTRYRVTETGSTALRGYLDHMESLIRAMRQH